MKSKLHNYDIMMVTDIMFVETKNGNFKSVGNGVVFDDDTSYFLGDYVHFNGRDYQITTVPEAHTMGSGNWIKVTFSVL